MSDNESYDSKDHYRERSSSSGSYNSGRSYLTNSDTEYFEAFIHWAEMADDPQRVELGNASIDRLASSLISSNNFRLRPFSGAKPASEGGGVEDIHRWVQDYEDLCGVNGWDDATKCQKIPAFLTGGARDYYREEIRGNEVADDWDQLKEALKTFYRPVDHRNHAMITLKQRMQRPLEPVQSYILEMKRLAKLADEQMGPDMVKFWIMEVLFPNLQVLTDEARRIEASLATGGPEMVSPAVPVSVIEPVEKALQVMTDQFQRMANLMETKPQDKQEGQQTDGQAERRACHYCGITGHLMLACRKRLADQQRNERQQPQSQGRNRDSYPRNERRSDERRDYRRSDSRERSYRRDSSGDRRRDSRSNERSRDFSSDRRRNH